MTMGEKVVKPGHLQGRQDALEEKLQQTFKERKTVLQEIQESQDELSKLFLESPSRPYDSLQGIDNRIDALEQERVRVSLPLSQEKMILKQIHKLQRSRQKVQEYVTIEESIRAKKSQVTQLRAKLRECSQKVTDIRIELEPVTTANHLGCEVEELLGRAVPVPDDKVGQIIGKQGRNIDRLSTASSVQLDVNTSSEQNVVRIVGSLASLHSAVTDLDRVIQQVDESVSLPDVVVKYVTSKGISVLEDIRESHPNVHVEASKTEGVMCRGLPSDIEAVRQDLEALKLSASKLTISSADVPAVIGKKGATIEGIVLVHQTAIDLKRQEENGTAAITITGPDGHVASAMHQIKQLVAANQDVEKIVEIHSIKKALLLGKGKGIQQLADAVNAAVEDKTAGRVLLNLTDKTILVKGKARVVGVAHELVAAEVRRLEQLVKTIKADPMAIPGLIGKGGERVNALRGDKAVSVEFNRESGDITISGMDEQSIEEVFHKTEALVQQHLVERIQFDPPSQYKTMIGGFVKALSKQISELVHMSLDDERQEILMTGSRDKLDEAKALIEEFLSQNYTEELEVTKEDMDALLTGGKSNKLLEFAKQTEVNTNVVRERQVVSIRGEKTKVLEAVKLIKQFLYGGEGISLVKLAIDSKVLGMVIGKGGKKLAELEEKHKVSIMILRNDNVIALRGPDADVDACRREIFQIIATARVSHQLKLSEDEAESLEKSKGHRRIAQHIPVQMTTEDGTVTIRGTQDDVRDVVAGIEEALGKPYSIGYFLETFAMKRVSEGLREPAALERIEADTGASIKIQKDHISFSGKRSAVKEAKREMVKFFVFLLGSKFRQVELDGPLLNRMSMSGAIGSIMAEAGCQLLIDRDISSILIFASDSEKVKNAEVLLEAKLEEEKKLMFIMELDPTEEWLVSLFLGKQGSQIKSLRKETKCKIDVANRIISLHAETEELLEAGKDKIVTLIDKLRREFAFVDIPKAHIPAFMGRGGANIAKFAEEHEVEMTPTKKGGSTIKIFGKEEDVGIAKDDIMEWIAARERRAAEEQATATLPIQEDQIGRVIGSKGSVIRGLQKEFRCKIDIDRDTSTITVKGPRRNEVLKKIEKIASGELRPNYESATSISPSADSEVEDKESVEDLAGFEIEGAGPENEHSEAENDELDDEFADTESKDATNTEETSGVSSLE